MRGEPIVFSIPSYQHLLDEMCRLGHLERGSIECRTFPDGERYQRICSGVAGRDVVLIGGTISDATTLELFDLASALVKYGAGRLTLLIPYFGYSTMERAVHPGEVVTAKTRARLFSSIPPAARGNRVFLLDLHTEGITHYFEGDVTPWHVSGKPLIAAACRRLGGEDFVVACTDAGRAKWVEALANELGMRAAFVFKRRLDDTRTEVTALSAQVDGCSVVIYDDMIRTGGSLIQAARAYKSAGAARLAAIATHGVFPENALEKLRDTGLFHAVVCTDSHPRARELAGDFLRVESIAPLLLDQLEHH